MSERTIEDGFGSCWLKCDRKECGLEVVRPGWVQCWCDSPKHAYAMGEEAVVDLYWKVLGWLDQKGRRIEELEAKHTPADAGKDE